MGPLARAAADARGSQAPSVLGVVLASSLVLAAATSSLAAAEPGREDVTFVAEHVLETGMDAGFFSLPLGFGRVRDGELHPSFDFGYAVSEAGLLDASGPLVSGGLAYGLSDQWALEGIAFYDRFRISGGAGEDELDPHFVREVPFGPPQFAELTPPDGRAIHWGAGLAVARQWDRSSERRGFWTLGVGALYDRLTAEDFVMGYRVTSGEQAGTTGTLDLSATYDFVTPFAVVQLDRPLGDRFRARPWLSVGFPLPQTGFAGRISGELPDGSSFDLSGDSDEAFGRAYMGDPFIGVGLAIEHQRTHLSLDVGSTLYHALYQPFTRSGTDQALLVHLAWHG